MCERVSSVLMFAVVFFFGWRGWGFRVYGLRLEMEGMFFFLYEDWVGLGPLCSLFPRVCRMVSNKDCQLVNTEW